MRNIDGTAKASGALIAGDESLAQVTIEGTDYLLSEMNLVNRIKLIFNSKKYEQVEYLGTTWIMWKDNLKDRFGLEQKENKEW